jgi:hypothetical protein
MIEAHMYEFGRNRMLILAFLSSTALLSAAAPAIGVAMSQGNIVVNSALTTGNATIFDGNTVQTDKASSQVRLKDGAQVRFDSQSRGRLFSDHVDLLQGRAEISGYAAIANGFSIRPEGVGSAVVSVHGKAIEVAALTGDVHVFNLQGLNVANLVPGRTLNFAPQDAGASAPSSLTGCAVKNKDNLFLTDENSKVTAQLRGGKVPNRKRITVTGAVAANAAATSPATQVVDVTSVKEIGGVCDQALLAASAGAAAAGAAAGAGAGVGLSAAAIAVVAVGGAAAVGGIAYAATSAAGSSGTTSPGAAQ